MGTRFKTLLAPIGVSTGDGRRFQDGAITLAATPFPFEWAREREGGHDGAVVVGVVEEATVLSVADALAGDWVSPENAKGLSKKQMAVWARGQLFDDVNRDDMPRLAEDVAEAMHLMGAGTLGPSVDLDSFDAVPVMEGSDTPVTWEEIEDYYEQHGEEPKLELLITEGRVRAATLVSIPAFSETSRPLELIVEDNPDAAEEEEGRDTGEARAELLTLVASMTAGRSLPEVGHFAMPTLDGPTPITWDWATGRVFGHIAAWRTCHVGYADVCVTPPHAEQGYSWFNRYAVETADGGTIWAGRITLGGQHAGLTLAASSAMAVYDSKTVAADVVAYEDDHGIVVAGVIRPELGAQDRAVLDRRKVSGDWREIGARLNLIEVLALSPGPRAHSEPGFPITTHSMHGRQVALTASFGPEDVPGRPEDSEALDALADRLLDRHARRAAERERALAARTELAEVLEADRQAARRALVDVMGRD